MVRAEYQLPDADLHRFTASRLRAWIDVHATDPGQARLLADAYDRVFARVPGGLALKRATVVQSVARTELTETELAALDGLVPVLTEAVAHRRGAASAASAAAVAGTTDPTRQAKRRWKFW